MIPSLDSRPERGNGGATRLPALVLTAAMAAAVCVLATWPRWHPAPGATAALAAPAQTPTLTVAASPTASAASLPGSAPGGMARGAKPTVPAGTPERPGDTASVAATVSSAPPPSAPGAPPPARPARLVPEVPDTAVSWHRLDDMQRIALAPFASEWDQFSFPQQRKWLAIASVYPRMSPDAQQRLHARMLRWTQMTPDERRLARENYEMSRVLPPNARQQAWHAYLALPAAQKEKLAAADRSHHRPLVVSAAPGGNPAPRAHHVAAHTAGHAASDALPATPGAAAAPRAGAPAAAPAALASTPPAPGARHRHASAAASPTGSQDDETLSRP
ncbi:MAG: DUF3106 domain-containing protein [Janthinobacterium lividum]